jgi:hypothetical protein
MQILLKDIDGIADNLPNSQKKDTIMFLQWKSNFNKTYSRAA